MKLLVTGKGTSGSWQIRGVQLGQAIGATVVPNAAGARGYDAAILVKRPSAALLRAVSGVPLIWDVVDSYPQPAGNGWDESQCKTWLRGMVREIKPAGIVAATEAMREDCAEFGIPVLALPHHARPRLRTNPIRELRVVGYEGNEDYLGRWREILETECRARGLKFVVNPAELAEVDIVVALRDSYGYAPRHWKSGVKLANAQGSGTPMICGRECGYLETQSGAERWADTADELRAALDWLAPREVRWDVSRRLQAAAPTLDAIAATYSAWLQSKF